MHRDAGDLLHRVDKTFDVLNVERGENVDAVIEQFQHALIAFAMARALSVGVRQFVD